MRYSVILMGIVTITFCTALYMKYNGRNGTQRNMTMEFSSPAFAKNGPIDPKYTCDGKDISPALNWKNAPGATKSFALICDDPDAPHGVWVHWVLYDIPTTVTSLPEGASAANIGAVEGRSSWGAEKKGYGGPCPPQGTHRYFFTLYALDVSSLKLAGQATKQEVKDAMEGHILEFVELMGTYTRK